MTVIATARTAPRRTWTIAGCLASPYFFWCVLALYLVALIALRLWGTPNIGKNDVQEAVAAQGWAWGYHPRNPPLHTWLLMGAYSVFGVGAVAHVVLKYALLGTTYAFAYLCGRKLLSNVTLASFSALSLMLIAPFAWTVHTALTHTLLMAALIFATLFAAIRLSERRRDIDYMIFGAAIGLGFLAKYSFALFLLPLLATMLSQPALRRAISDWRMALTLAVAVLLFAPHANWMLTARFDFVRFLSEKQASGIAQPYWADVALGLEHIAFGALAFLAPLILVFPAVFGRSKPIGGVRVSPWVAALTLMPAFGLGLLLLDVLVLRATQFEERYFMCSLLMTPLALFLWLDRRAPPDRALRWFGISIAVSVLIIFCGLAGRHLLYQRTCSRCLEEMNIAAVREAATRDGFTGGAIIAPDYNVAGNMRLAFPRSHVVAANYRVDRALPAAAGGQCLVVWNARIAGDATPAALADYAREIGLVLPTEPPRFVVAPLLRSARMDRFAFWVVPGADGACQMRR